jgi:hypothetical protein
MSLMYHLALVCEPKNNKRIAFRQLASVSAALQKQIARDFAPIWQIQATIDPFEHLEDVPLGYWPIIIADDIHTPGAAGVHEDRMGQPFSLVKSGALWSLTASHECLEMLADPFGNRTVTGLAPTTAQGEASANVEFLVEVCDPCEDVHFAYGVNDIPVSDFYTPHYFDAQKVSGTRYDFTGNISEPRQVLSNGYLSWHDAATGQWWQSRGFGPNPLQPVPLGKLIKRGASMRSMIDARTPTPLEDEGLGLNQADSTHSVAGGGCIGCPSCSMFSRALRSGKLLADYDGGGGFGVPPEMAADAKALRGDIDAVKRSAAANAKSPKAKKPRKGKK